MIIRDQSMGGEAVKRVKAAPALITDRENPMLALTVG